jgi:hypothetical protein
MFWAILACFFIIGLEMFFGVKVSPPKDRLGRLIVGLYYLLATIFTVAPLAAFLTRIILP